MAKMNKFRLERKIHNTFLVDIFKCKYLKATFIVIIIVI